MNQNQPERSFGQRILSFIYRHQYPIAALILGLFAGCLAFAFSGFFPFGSRSLNAMDCWGQYYPMLRELKTALSRGDLLYSFDGGLGFNLIAQISYYTASPSWLLLCLLPARYFTAGIHILTLLKFAFAAFTFSLLLRGVFHKESAFTVALSLAYAFGSYGIAFINQIMWMDAVVIAPLMVLGIEKLIRDKKPLLYYVSLSLALISSFYLGYMLCLFSVLCYLFRSFAEKASLRERFFRALRYGTFSLLSGGTAAVMLLPVYLAIQKTIASDLGFTGPVKWYFSFAQLLHNMMPFGHVSLEFGAPNLYAGAVVLLLVPAFLFCGGIPLRRRFCFGLFTGLMFLSFNCNLTDYIWHGFHYPNQLPGRQSFLFLLLVLFLSYEAFVHLEDMKPLWMIVSVAAAPLSVLFVLLRHPGESKDFKLMTIYVGLGCLLALMFLLTLYQSSLRDKGRFCRVLSLILACWVAVEPVSSATYMLTKQTNSSHYDDIVFCDDEMADFLASYGDSKNEFHRIEWLPLYHFNPGQCYGFKGVTYYSSMMSAAAYRFFEACGDIVYAKNVSTRYVQSPILNAMFGIKYLIDRSGTNYIPGLTQVSENGAVKVWENTLCLPLGFMVEESMKDFANGTLDTYQKPTAFQNDWMKATGAVSSDLFRQLSSVHRELENAMVVTDDGKQYFYRTDKEAPVSASFSYPIVEDGDYFASLVFRTGTVIVEVNGKQVATWDAKKNAMIYAGSLKAGDNLTFRVIIDGYNYALFGLTAYRFDTEGMEQTVNTLRQSGLSITESKPSSLKGTIDADKDGMLFLTLPYDGGWTLTVDGKETELFPVAEFLSGAMLSEGSHTVSLSYCPPGLKTGALLSGGSLVLAVLLLVLPAALKKKKAVKEADA